MIYGYARVSTDGQSVEAHVAELTADLALGHRFQQRPLEPEGSRRWQLSVIPAPVGSAGQHP